MDTSRIKHGSRKRESFMHTIIKLIAQRFTLGILLLVAASVLIFGLTEALPGDAAQAVLGQAATPESLANLREEMGLNSPATTRYFEWFGCILQVDMGVSITVSYTHLTLPTILLV